MNDARMQEIRAAMATMNTAQLAQAVRDAGACRESRRTRRGCGCFCCDLLDYLKETGADVVALSHAR